MITFDYHTYKAEINAMPCLPDEFEIHISRQTILMMHNNIRVPSFKDYDQTQREEFGAYVLRYKRFKYPAKQAISVQDLILAKLKNSPN